MYHYPYNAVDPLKSLALWKYLIFQLLKNITY